MNQNLVFELKISSNVISDSNVAVSWCVSPEVLEYLKKAKILDPHVVLIVVPQNKLHREVRKVVPLKDLMTYVEFNFAGINIIHAFISNFDCLKNVEAFYLSKNRVGRYNTFVLDQNCNLIKDYDSYVYAEPLLVSVPEECFAPEPSEWEKTWVNHFWKEPAFDQCQFRKRRLFAYLIQPILIVMLMIFRYMIFTIGLSFGIRGFEWKALIHPFKYTTLDLILNTHGVFFVRKTHDNEPPNSVLNLFYFVVYKFALVPFTPIIVILHIVGYIFNPLHMLKLDITILFGIQLFILIIGLLISNDASRILELFKSSFGNKSNELNEEDVKLLACTNSEPINYESLPPNKRTIKLRLANLKAKICKSYSL